MWLKFILGFVLLIMALVIAKSIFKILEKPIIQMIRFRHHRPIFERFVGGLIEQVAMADRADLIFDFIAAPNGIIIDNRPAEHRDTDVHDHAIQESIKKSYSKLEQWALNNPGLVISTEDTLEQIKNYIFKNGDSTEKIEKAYSTIKVIKKHNGYLYAIKRNELEVLSHVWSRIQAPVNISVKKDLEDHLIEQLAEANINFEAEQARCLTGRISRMIQSLESIDMEGIVNIVSTSVIKKELNDKVPFLINKYMNTYWSPEQIDKYNHNDGVLANQLRQYIKKHLMADYLDNKLLTPIIFEEITKPYLEEI